MVYLLMGVYGVAAFLIHWGLTSLGVDTIHSAVTTISMAIAMVAKQLENGIEDLFNLFRDESYKINDSLKDLIEK